MNPALDAAVEALREQTVETLSRWIRIPSEKQAATPGAPFGAPLRQMLDTALADASGLGLKARCFDGYAGDVEIGEGDEVMGILAHLDVVPAGDGWQHDPFGAALENGRMYGRGTSDDKGPAVAALFAMKAVLNAGIPLRRRVRLILGCDEESGSECIAYYKKHEKMPDFGFSPDADYPVINTEKGIETVVLEADLPGEDGAEYPLYEAFAGERVNVIPGSAWARVGCRDFSLLEERLSVFREETGYDITCKAAGPGEAKIVSRGAIGHAAFPASGKNAAGQLLLALKAIGAGGGSRECIVRLADAIGMESDGKSLGIAGSDDLSGPLTLNLGLLRLSEGRLRVALNIRFPVLFDGDRIASLIGLNVREAGLRVTDVSISPPLHVPASSFIVSSLLKVYRETTGLDAYTIAIGGGTYSRTMDNCVAFGACFPGDEDRAHIADEYMDLDKLMLNVRIFAHAIAALAG